MNCAIDVSVLEACEPTAPIGVAEITLISKWLDDFESDSMKRLTIDQGFRLWKDYEQFSEQNRAALALLQKVDAHLAIPVTAPKGSLPALGCAWAHLDAHRVWLLAVSLSPLQAISIVNATHIEWHEARLPKDPPLPTVLQLIPAWLTERARGLAPLDAAGPYVAPPASLTGALAAAVSKGCGKNGRKAWEDATYRYEWDYQHGRVEVYRLSTGAWVHEAAADGVVIKTSGGDGRVWGR